MGLSENGIKVVSITEEYIESFHRCLDLVARERKYLGMVEAPTLESTREFVMSNIEKKSPQYVAVKDNQVIGWCDALPRRGEGFTHSATLGMGVAHGYRGQGIGTLLMNTVIDAAKKAGVERVELEVYASNISAIRLYEKRGFKQEGVKRNARKLDGEYDDILVMALFL